MYSYSTNKQGDSYCSVAKILQTNVTTYKERTSHGYYLNPGVV